MGKQKKKEKAPVALVLALAAAVAAVGGGWYAIDQRTPSKKQVNLKSYFNIEGDDEIAVSAEDAISETKGKVIDGQVYLDYDSVHKYINPSFYYEADSKLLIVTTPTEKVTLDLSDGGAAEHHEAEILDGTLYISEDYVKKWSDAVIEDYPEEQYVAVQTDWEKTAAKTTEETAVRVDPSIKAEIVESLGTDETVQLLDGEATDGWTYVRTASGKIGYVQKEALGEPFIQNEEHVSAIGDYTSAYQGGKVNMAFHQTTSQAANDALPQVIDKAEGVNVVAPTWFFLNNNEGEMTSLASKSYVDTAHSTGLKVWAVMNDFDGGVNSSASTKDALSRDTYRTKLIASVMNGVDASGADGVNVDFEKVTQESAESFLELIRELSVECRNRGIVLSVDNYVPTYTKFLNRGEQARVADFVVTMCYDEHTSGSEEAGSVASLPFMRNGLEATMKEDGVPASKMIAAIPFYTRLWTTSASGEVESTAYTMADAASAVANLGMQTAWDDSSAQNYGKIEQGDQTYEIWLEDEDSVKAKMEVVKELDLAGVAEWKLGQENSDVWSIISEYLA